MPEHELWQDHLHGYNLEYQYHQGYYNHLPKYPFYLGYQWQIPLQRVKDWQDFFLNL